MPKTLITGGAGTIGYFLTKSLAGQGHDVMVADNLSRGKMDSEMQELLKMPNVRFLELDVTDSNQFKSLPADFDYVYHLAAINGTRNFYEIPEKVLRVGVLGTINVLEWFKEQKKGKILFTSSNEGYASYINLTGGPIPTPESVPLCIDDVFNARWSYGGSKIIGELFFINYARTFKFPMSIVRFHNSYGPRMGREHVIPEFLGRIIRKEDPFKISGSDATRSFCYIDDTISAVQLVMESEKTNNEIVHVGNNKEEITILELANKMFDLFGWRPKNLEIQPAPPGSVKRRCPDLNKIKNLTGFEAKVPLTEGLNKTYEWYAKNEG